MSERALKSLYDAVKQLDSEKPLALLNIDGEILDDPATTLEYVERYSFWQQLRNVVSSIPDLLSQDEHIALIGFLGHFSSGKSSLINALMGIGPNESPGYRRAVGTHPTDTGITLITHRDHAERIRKSSYTVVKQLEVVHGPAIELLEHATLVDTPGLGNEAEEREIVTRFLHLCHVLVITIDGRRPFADKDKDFDLLDTAFNKLSGIPKVIAVTSAEEFLTSRKGDFATDWNKAEADEFWTESIRRLKSDPRFEQHIYEFQNAQRFFVDSKEGFNVEDVSNVLIPIVRDDAHKIRIRRAQGRYVLEVALESLLVLNRYISSRSDNLNRLLSEAQSRADNTKTAVEELLQSLESEFSDVSQKMQATRQNIPNLAFPIATIVTPNVISQRQKKELTRLELKITSGLATQVRKDVVRLAKSSIAAYRRATRRWRPRKAQVSFDAIQRTDDSLISSIPGKELAATSIECATDIFRVVNEQLRQQRRAGLEHLDSPSERYAIGSRVRDIAGALDYFERIYDDAVKGFLAYVTQPSSSDLLKEHGFVGFDDSGEQAVKARSLYVKSNTSHCAIRTAGENCRASLTELSDSDNRDYEQSIETLEKEEDLQEEAIAESFPENVAKKVAFEFDRKLTDCRSALKDYVEKLHREYQVEKTDKTNRTTAIWTARGTIFVRFLLVLSILAIVGIGIEYFRPNTLANLWASLPGGIYTGILVSLVSTLILMMIVFVISGTSNPTLATALGSTLRARFGLYMARRSHIRRLRSHAEDTVEKLAEEIKVTQLSLDTIIVDASKSWLEASSPAYKAAIQELSNIETGVQERVGCLDEFTNTTNEELAKIPAELREAADRIRADAIENHMSRIREAADAVNKLRTDLDNIVSAIKAAL